MVDISSISASLNTVFIAFSSFLVFLMLVGFAMFEVGSVRAKFKTHVISLVLIDLICAVIAWWILGYGFAYGSDFSGFIGNQYFAGSEIEKDQKYTEWLFEWTFALGVLVLSGSVSERVNLLGYAINSFFITAFVYPVIVHWAWGGGWLMKIGYKDFAGSGVVHLTGGVIALVGAKIIGPRKNRWNPDYINEFQANNKQLVAFGTLFLWFGWYGFNCGATLSILDDNALVMMRVGMNTTLAAASGGGTALLVFWYLKRKEEEKFEVCNICNGILGGLVGITSSCDNVESWAAVIIGVIAAFIYTFDSWLLKKLRIDDTIEISAVNGGGGCWGVIAVGIFNRDNGIIYGNGGYQLGIQLLGVVSIMVWAGGLGICSISFLNKIGIFRMSEALEIRGTDVEDYKFIKFPLNTEVNKNMENEKEEYQMITIIKSDMKIKSQLKIG